MYSSLQIFLLLFFCAYGGIIPSPKCDDRRLGFESATAADIIEAMEEMEFACEPSQLIKRFDTALEIFRNNTWTDPDKYLIHSRDYFYFLSDLTNKLRNVNLLKVMDSSEMLDLWQSCIHPRKEQSKHIIRVQQILSIPFNENNTFLAYALHNPIIDQKATIFCDIMTKEYKKPSCNLTILGNETLRIYGDYVRVLDAVKIAQEYKQRDFQNIEIFAASKLIIDEDLRFFSNKAVNVIIMAPTWTVPYCNHNGCEHRIEVINKKSGSIFFGMGCSFIATHMLLTVRIEPKPPSYNYLTFYNLNGPSESPVAITDFGEKSKEPNPAETGFDYHTHMNNYTRFLLETKENAEAKYTLEAFYDYQHFKLSMFNTFGFAQELLTLEDHFFTLYQKRISADRIYRALNRRFNDFAFSPKPNETSSNFNELRNNIRTAIWSKIDVIASKDALELDLVKYISEGVNDLIKMGDVTKREKGKKITLFKEDMKANIRSEIKQADTFIQNVVIPKVNELNEKVDVQLDNALRAATAIRRKVITDVQIREWQESDVMIFRLFKSFTTVVTAVASLFSGPAAIAFVVLGSAMTAAFDIPGEPEVDEVKVPGSIRNVESFVESKSRVFDHMLEILGNNQPRLLGSLKKEIKDVQEAMKEGTDAAPFEKIMKLLETKEEELKASSGASGSSRALGIVKQLQKILKLSQLASPDAYLKYRNDTTAMQVLDAISAVEDDEDVQAANLYERQIHTLIAPAIKYFNNFTAGLANSTSGKTQAEIDVLRWTSNSLLQNIRFRLKEFASSMYEGKLLLETIDELSSALNLVFDLANKIMFYNHCWQLIKYIGDVNAVEFATPEYDNEEIGEAISKMQYLIKYNAVIARYKKTVNSYRLYAFPFTPMISGLIDYDFSQNYSNIHTVKDMAMNAEIMLGNMGMRMDAYKYSLTNDKDIDIVEGPFDQSVSNRDVFYGWYLEKGSAQLNSLFSGKETVLQSDITSDFALNKNAVKFKRIGLRFIVLSPNMQNRLDEGLASLVVTMTHSGESYYKCDDQYYKATTENMTIRFSIAEDASGMPVFRGKAYNKLINGNYLLSPYTTWKIRLESSDGDFYKLRDLKDHNIGVMLIGDGQYVKGKDACSYDLDRYYDVVN